MNETWSSIQIRAIEENPANVNVDFLGSKEWPNPKLLGKNGVNNQALNSATRKHFEKNSIKANVMSHLNLLKKCVAQDIFGRHKQLHHI